MSPGTRGLVEVHLATLMYGFVGPVGKAVDLDPFQIVFWRSTLAAVILLVVARRLESHSPIRTWADLATLTVIAGLLVMQWGFFFKSIKVSTIAIGLLTTYTYPVFMVFLESWFFKLRLRALDFASAAAVLVGIYFLVPEFDLADATFQGVIYGVTGGAMIPLIVLIRKKRIIGNYNSWDLSAYESGIAGLILIPFMLHDAHLFRMPGSGDLLLLVVLGVVLTGCARTLFIDSHRYLSAKVVGVIRVLEVVYGVVLALIIFAAVPSNGEIIGGLIIVSAAMFESMRSRWFETADRNVGGER